MGKSKKENRLVVGDGEWAKSLPEWLLEEVKSERLICGLAGIMNGGESTVGDAEVAVYLFTASLRQPLSHEDAEIYVYITTQLMKRRKKEIPEEMRKEKLTEYEQGLLEEMRRMIYRRRGGEIVHPVLDMLRVMKKDCQKQEAKEPGQLLLRI